MRGEEETAQAQNCVLSGERDLQREGMVRRAGVSLLCGEEASLESAEEVRRRSPGLLAGGSTGVS